MAHQESSLLGVCQLARAKNESAYAMRHVVCCRGWIGQCDAQAHYNWLLLL